MSLLNKAAGAILSCLVLLCLIEVDAEDYAGPYRPRADELRCNLLREFIGWDEGAFAKLTLDDSRLKRAYASVFEMAVGKKLLYGEPEWDQALADMRKRGDSITPMLLKLMDENQETGVESSILVKISSVGTVNVEPYLEYARRVLRDRTQTMSATLAGCASNLLAEHGTEEDTKLLKWVMETRPYVADSVTRELDALNRRLGLPKQGTRPPLRESSWENGKDINSRRSPQRPQDQGIETKPAVISRPYWVLLAFIATGVLVIFLKKRK